MSWRFVKPLRAPVSNLWMLAPAFCLLVIGCSSGPQMQQDLYTRELRLQEDEIYRLEDCIEEYQAIIRSMRQENAQLRRATGAAAAVPRAEKIGDEGSSPAEEGSSERSLLDNFDWQPDRPAPTPPATGEPLPGDAPGSAPAGGDDGVPDIELPLIDGGEPAEAPVFEPAAIDSPAAPAVDPPFIPPATPSRSAPAPTGAEEVPPPAEPPGLPNIPLGAAEPLEPDARVASSEQPLSFASGAAVAAVTLNASSGPLEPTGEQTLLATARPIGHSAEVALFKGSASLLIRDPSLPAEQAELARWDYSDSEVSASWQGLASDPRLAFALVLPEETPRDRALEVWVRLVEPSGRKYLAQSFVRLGDSGAEELAANDHDDSLKAAAPFSVIPVAATEPIATRRDPAETAAAAHPTNPPNRPPADGWAPRYAGASAAGATPASQGWLTSGATGSARSTVRVAVFEEASNAKPIGDAEPAAPVSPARGWSRRSGE